MERNQDLSKLVEPDRVRKEVYTDQQIFEPVEIQVRTLLQHLWAEVSEKSSDVLDPAIKYGGGTYSWRTFLTATSESVASYEDSVKAHSKAVALKNVADAAHERRGCCLHDDAVEVSSKGNCVCRCAVMIYSGKWLRC